MCKIRTHLRVALLGALVLHMLATLSSDHLGGIHTFASQLMGAAWSSQRRTSSIASSRHGPLISRRSASGRSEPWFSKASPQPEVAGERPLLFFLPGIDGSGRSSSKQFQRLALFFECWTLTIPPGDRSSLAVLVELIADFISERREGSRQVLLLAESMGSMSALAVALGHPELVDALCLLNPATSYGQSPISLVAPLLPGLPKDLYSALPAAVTPLFGKLGWYDGIAAGAASSDALPGPGSFSRVSRSLSELLPPETLRFREALLRRGGRRVDLLFRELRASREVPPWANRTLLLAGDADLVLPSVAETRRLAELIPGAKRMVLPGVAHVAFDDEEVNLLGLLTSAGIMEALAETSEAKPERVPAAVDMEPDTWLASALTQARSWVSPVFMSTMSNGTIVRGLQEIVPPTEGGAPILFVGNHQLFSLDGPLIVEEFLREQQQLLTALVYPPLLSETSPLDPLPYPFPGTKELFEKFQVQPAGARNLLRALKPGKAALLFPGGAREVFKRKGEDYQLFWPSSPDLVRLAARVNATIVPFSGVGSDEFFAGRVLDSDELLSLPLVGDWLRERTKDLPSFVEDDVFVPPVPVPRLQGPRRNYFLFGRPISTHGLNAKDRGACSEVYSEIQTTVEQGIEHLLRAREEDPFEQTTLRFALERGTGVQAPSFSLEGRWGRSPEAARA